MRPQQHQKIILGNTSLQVEMVESPELQQKGLSDRDSLEMDTGMLFVFSEKGSYGFWMKDMKFPIDIIWIVDDTVVGVTGNVSPETSNDNLKVYSPPQPIDRVLEVNAGFASQHGIKVGDKIKNPADGR